MSNSVLLTSRPTMNRNSAFADRPHLGTALTAAIFRVAAFVLAWVLTFSPGATPLRADNLSTTTIDFGSGGDVGKVPAHAIIAGNPAVAYYDHSEGTLRFARNSAADGSGTWSITVVQPVPTPY